MTPAESDALRAVIATARQSGPRPKTLTQIRERLREMGYLDEDISAAMKAWAQRMLELEN